MKVTVYGIRNCDTMKKASAWLDAHGVAYDFHDYRKSGVPSDRLAAWAAAVGWEKLANVRGTTWRRIPDAARSGLDERRMLKLLGAHPSAIRRPVVEWGRRITVGFDAALFSRMAGQ